jgi:hypothetical protein
MVGVREKIIGVQIGERVSVLSEVGDVTSQRCRVASNVDNAVSTEIGNLVYNLLARSGTRWIHDDNVSPCHRTVVTVGQNLCDITDVHLSLFVCVQITPCITAGPLIAFDSNDTANLSDCVCERKREQPSTGVQVNYGRVFEVETVVAGKVQNGLCEQGWCFAVHLPEPCSGDPVFMLNTINAHRFGDVPLRVWARVSVTLAFWLAIDQHYTGASVRRLDHFEAGSWLPLAVKHPVFCREFERLGRCEGHRCQRLDVMRTEGAHASATRLVDNQIEPGAISEATSFLVARRGLYRDRPFDLGEALQLLLNDRGLPGALSREGNVRQFTSADSPGSRLAPGWRNAVG